MKNTTSHLIIEAIHAPENEVDRLLARAAEIQSACQHAFQLTHSFELAESLTADVFMAIGDRSVEMRCVDCSMKKVIYITSICPRCQNNMRTESTRGLGKKYVERMENSVAIRRCDRCQLCIATVNY